MKLSELDEKRTEILEALRRPFPPEAIERTRGSQTGKGYDTTGIKGIYITERLNEVVGLDGWRISAVYSDPTVRQTQKGADMVTVVCDLDLVIGGLNDAGVWTPWAIRSAVGWHESRTIGDARKGAQTNALKRAASLLGLGWQAWADLLDEDNRRADSGAERRGPPSPEEQAEIQRLEAALQAFVDRLGPDEVYRIIRRPKSELTTRPALLRALERLAAAEAQAQRAAQTPTREPSREPPAKEPAREAPATSAASQGASRPAEPQASRERQPAVGSAEPTPRDRLGATGQSATPPAPQGPPPALSQLISAAREAGVQLSTVTRELYQAPPDRLTPEQRVATLSNLKARAILATARRAQGGGR